MESTSLLVGWGEDAALVFVGAVSATGGSDGSQAAWSAAALWEKAL